MLKSELLTFVNENLLDGRAMDETLFDTLLNLAKDKVEGSRPWVQLRSEDGTEAISSGNTWETLHNLPTRFREPYPVKRSNGTYSALVLVSGTEVVVLEEIQWPNRLEKQDSFGYYAINPSTGKYILTGAMPKAYTAYWSFITYSPVLEADGDEWVFPSNYHPLLGYLVAAMEKARDYDEVNMANIAQYLPEAGAIIAAMNLWDTNRQRAMHGV